MHARLARRIAVCLLAAFLSAVSAADEPPFRARRALRAVVYPFVPDRTGLFRLIEQSFEATYPEIDLQIVDLSSNYYDESEPRAVTNSDADVMEVDSVFLDDLIGKGRIQPIRSALRVSNGPLLPVAEDAVTAGAEWYGVPHWVCTNYLMSRPGDELANAATLTDVSKAIGENHLPGRGLLIDMKGRSTLGELYLDALLDKYKTLAAAAPYVAVGTRDQAVVDDLKMIRGLCDADLCRDSDYHDTVGFYARQFARGRGRALAGYSERLYYIGTEVLTSCRKGECKGLDEIALVPLPLSSTGSQPFAWVDSFTISSSCTRQCLLDAEAFIRHTTSMDEVRKQLTPGWGDAPRYLMPALALLYSDSDLLKVAPLYAKLHPTIRQAIGIRQPGLNAALREMGRHLDRNELPK